MQHLNNKKKDNSFQKVILFSTLASLANSVRHLKYSSMQYMAMSSHLSSMDWGNKPDHPSSLIG